MTELDQRFPALDGLRGLAIALVLYFHLGLGWIAVEPGTLAAYVLVLPLRVAWSGVDLFFVLSGFLITRILLLSRDDPGFLRVFYGRRAMRILPLYGAMLLLFYLGLVLERAALIDMPRLFGDANLVWAYPFFVQNLASIHTPSTIHFLSVSWTLALEEQMYLLLSTLVLLSRRRRAVYGLVALLLIGYLGRAWLDWTHTELGLRAASHLRVDGFAVGGLIAYAHVHGALVCNARCRRLGWALLVPGAVATVAVAAGSLSQAQQYGAFPLLYGGLLLLALGASPAGIWYRIWTFAPLMWLGKVSYGLYLIHMPVLGLVLVAAGLGAQELMVSRPWWVGATALVLSLALAQLSFARFEAPLIAWGRRQFSYQSTSMEIANDPRACT